jgi:hypothetical protein
LFEKENTSAGLWLIILILTFLIDFENRYVKPQSSKDVTLIKGVLYYGYGKRI